MNCCQWKYFILYVILSFLPLGNTCNRRKGSSEENRGDTSDSETPDDRSPLERAAQNVRNRIQAEFQSVRDRQARKLGDGVGDRLMSFLSSNPEVRFVSHLASTQLNAMKQCRSQSRLQRLKCKKFWASIANNECGGESKLRTPPRANTNHQQQQVHQHGRLPRRYLHYHGSTIPDNLLECPFAEAPICGNDTLEFRTFDGTCNNRVYTLAGAANRALARSLPAHYDDCIETIRKSVSGKELPSAREVSQKLFAPLPITSKTHTVMHMTFGQLLDHDTDITAISKFSHPDTDELVNVECGGNGCKTKGLENEQCLPIWIPDSDDFFTDNSAKPCLKFVRSQEFLQDGCKIGPREQPNQITSWLDASFLYGSNEDSARSLRTFVNGRMRTTTHPLNPSFKDLLPLQDDASCRNTTEQLNCFQAGDGRRNEQVGLQALHTLFLRYHNYLVDNLKQKHPYWDDEQLYQNARKICGGVWQHIVYNEYLPLTLGPEFMKLFDLIPKRSGYYTGYSDNKEKVNPDVTSEFAAAAFRFGHSQIGDTLRFVDPTYSEHEDVHFSHVFFNPTRIYYSGIRGNDISGVNAVILGMVQQRATEMDRGFSTQVSNSLFTDSPPHGRGTDLPAVNIQRGRDHGLPGYNRWREWCKDLLNSKSPRQKLMTKGQVKDFEDLIGEESGYIVRELDLALKAVYGRNGGRVDDIDLYPGGLVENKVVSGLVGPTFGCIIAKQFSDLKRGDRFFYENENYFTLDQLDNIRQQTFSSILCQTLEDDRDIVNRPDTTLRIQKRSMLVSKDMAVAHLVGSGMRNVPELYTQYSYYKDGDENELQLCDDIPALNFVLF